MMTPLAETSGGNELIILSTRIFDANHRLVGSGTWFKYHTDGGLTALVASEAK